MTSSATRATTPSSGPAPLPSALESPTTVQEATERLQQSRCVMREQMLALNNAAQQTQAARRHAQRHPGALRATLSALPLIGPLIDPLIDSAVAWWNNHPLREVADLFASRSTATPRPPAPPITQRQPWAVLAGAAAAGALLVWWRPWRHRALRRALYAGMLPRLYTVLLSRLSAGGVAHLLERLLRPTASAPASRASAPSAAPAMERAAASSVTAASPGLHPGSSSSGEPSTVPADDPAPPMKRPA